MFVSKSSVAYKSESLRKTVTITIGVTLLWVLSQISIPLQPVPITLQTVGVLALGLLYERREAVFSVLIYLSLGAIGLPMFANLRGGFLVLAGPTGGYLVGFLVAVIVMTTFRQWFGAKKFVALMLNCFLGTATTLVCGIVWLSTFVGFNQAITLGLVPFIMPGVIKAAMLSAAISYVRQEE